MTKARTNKSNRVLKKALQNSTREQRKSSTQQSTVAIESIRRIVNLLKPWELSSTQRLRTYHAMLRDEAVWSSFETRSNLIQESQHNGSLSYDQNNPESVKLAKFFNYCMNSMDMQTVRSIASMFSETMVNGFALAEVVTKEGTGDWVGYYTLKKLSYISPLSLSTSKPFETIDGGNTITKWYQDPISFINSNGTKNTPKLDGGKVPIDARKVIFTSYSTNPANPLGTSPFDAAYAPWREKVLINEFLIMGVQKDMAGIPILEVPQELLDDSREVGSDAWNTIEAIKAQMTNLNAGDQSFMIMPSDTWSENGSGGKMWNITFKGVEGDGKAFDLEKLVDQKNRAIHKALGSLHLNSAEQGSASYNSLEGQTNIQYHYAKNDSRITDDAWNKQIFPLLLRLNEWYPKQEDIPVWEHGEMQDISLEEFGKYIQRVKLYLPQVPEVVNRVLEVAKINYRVPNDYTPEQIKVLMPEGVVDRSGESGGTSGFGDNTQDMDNNLENTA